VHASHLMHFVSDMHMGVCKFAVFDFLTFPYFQTLDTMASSSKQAMKLACKIYSYGT